MDTYNGTCHGPMLKALNYIIMGAAVTALFVFAFTGKLALSISVGALSLIAKPILYYLHENLRAFVNSGNPKP